MAFTNPFNRVKNLDDYGYLRVSVKNFLDLEGRPQQFYDAITQLQTIREGLIVAQQGGLTEPIAPAFEFYKGAILWLQLNRSIDQGVAVSAITNYEDINDSVAASFEQYVNWLRSNYLVNQPIYQTIQTELGRQKLDSLKSLELKADALDEEFKNSLLEAQTNLAESTDARNRELSDSLASQYNTQLQAINDASRAGVADIKQAQALTVWYEAYENNIELYETKLNGKDWDPLEFRNRLNGNFMGKFRQFIDKRKALKRSNRYSVNMPKRYLDLKFLWYAFSRSFVFALEALWHSAKYVVDKAIISTRGKRTTWFVVLGTVLIGQSILFLTLLLKNDLKDIPFSSLVHGVTLANLTDNNYIFAKISIFLGIILVPSLGYAFANRNYRIYSNLLEQYRHRATVAQTLQGVLRYIDDKEENKDIRVSLTTVAAVAMFEMKNVGHLSKRDGDTLPTGEVLQGVLGRK
ncbi:MAG: hypothetical protein AAB436_00335 [Patescibacteria group bacterium]